MLGKQPTLSVIIPTFNRAKYLDKAIESVLAQTYDDYEIVVIDDGSTDDTREILEPYIDQIRYLYQENAGVSAARNAGVKEAKGEWIAFLDSDDMWLPHKLACQMEYINDSISKVCFTDVVHIQKGEIIKYSDVKKSIAIQGEILSEPFDLILDDSRKLYVQTMVIKRELLCEVGNFDENFVVAEDTQLIFKLAFKTPFAYISEPLVVINRSDEREGLTNESCEAGYARCRAGIAILSEAYFQCSRKDKTIIRKLRQRLAYFLSRKAEFDCVEGNSKDARRLAFDSIYFGSDVRTYIRAFGVLCTPWLVRWKRKDV